MQSSSRPRNPYDLKAVVRFRIALAGFPTNGDNQARGPFVKARKCQGIQYQGAARRNPQYSSSNVRAV